MAQKIVLRICNIIHVLLFFALAIGFAIFEPFKYFGNTGFATGYRIGAGIGLGVLYLCYWLDVMCFDSTFRFLNNISTLEIHIYFFRTREILQLCLPQTNTCLRY